MDDSYSGILLTLQALCIFKHYFQIWVFGLWGNYVSYWLLFFPFLSRRAGSPFFLSCCQVGWGRPPDNYGWAFMSCILLITVHTMILRSHYMCDNLLLVQSDMCFFVHLRMCFVVYTQVNLIHGPLFQKHCSTSTKLGTMLYRSVLE